MDYFSGEIIQLNKSKLIAQPYLPMLLKMNPCKYQAPQ